MPQHWCKTKGSHNDCADGCTAGCLAAAARRKSAAERPQLLELLDLLRMLRLLQPEGGGYRAIRDRAFCLLGWLGMMSGALETVLSNSCCSWIGN